MNRHPREYMSKQQCSVGRAFRGKWQIWIKDMHPSMMQEAPAWDYSERIS